MEIEVKLVIDAPDKLKLTHNIDSQLWILVELQIEIQKLVLRCLPLLDIGMSHLSSTTLDRHLRLKEGSETSLRVFTQSNDCIEACHKILE